MISLTVTLASTCLQTLQRASPLGSRYSAMYMVFTFRVVQPEVCFA